MFVYSVEKFEDVKRGHQKP